MPTGTKGNTPADALAQSTGPNYQMQQSGTFPPATTPRPPKKSRRKLNSAIFDVDTAAALKIKAQAEPPMVGTKKETVPEVIVQRVVTGADILPDPPLKGPSEGAPVEHPLGVGNVAGEQLQTQHRDVSRRNHPNIVSQLIKTGARQDDSSPEIVVAAPSSTPEEDSRLPEVRVVAIAVHGRPDPPRRK